MTGSDLPAEGASEQLLPQTVPNRRSGAPAEVLPPAQPESSRGDSFLPCRPATQSPHIAVSFQADAVASAGNKHSVNWPELGQDLCGFTLIGELGRGGFSRVFVAEQADLARRTVVLKVSEPEGAEPQTLAQLQHTHIVPIYSVHEDLRAGLRGVCMPYFGGASLTQVLAFLWRDGSVPLRGRQFLDALDAAQQGQPTPPAGASPEAGRTPRAVLGSLRYDRACAWVAARLAEALEHAQQRGVLHRDVKPPNVLIAADGQPLLVDFNVAHSDSQPRLDANVGGTPAYASPEHLHALLDSAPVLARRVDHRADIYSLGLVLYEMLTGHRPFAEGSNYLFSANTLAAMVEERSRTVPSLRSRRPDLPWSLESILRICLDPEPQRRYQRAEHLADDLRRFVDDRPLRFAPEPSWRERAAKWLRRHPRLTSSGGVAVVASLLLATAGAALVGVHRHLAGAEERLHATETEERRWQFEAATVRALCLVNTVADLDDPLPRGRAVCEQALALYRVLDGDDWQRQPEWQGLGASERRRLGENVRELLLLLAWARVHQAPRDPAVLRGALALLDRAAAVEGLPPSPALWRDRAHYLEALGDADGARAAHARAVATPAVSAQDHYLLATAHARAGGEAGLRRALAELDQALALNPRHYWALTQRGICLLERGAYPLAVADFSDAVSLWPEFAWGHFNRGVALSRCGEKERAEGDFTRALERDPALLAARVNRGLLRLELRRPAGALSDFAAALRHGCDDATLHTGRGAALEALGRHAEADAAFADAFARLPSLPAEAQARIRWAYGFAVCQRKPAEARAAFDAVLRDQPQHPQALYGRAVLAVAAGRDDEGLDFATRAADADPGFLDARRSRAVLLARRGRFEEAERDINQCLERDGRSGITLYAAACVTALAAGRSHDAAVAGQALTLLERAVAHGYGRDQAAADPDLAALRTDARFLALLASRAPRGAGLRPSPGPL